MKISIILILIIAVISIVSCDNHKVDKLEDATLQSPEGLAKQYINFLNNGAKFEELRKILISEDDVTLIYKNGKANPELKELKNLYHKQLLSQKNSWGKWDFKRILESRPYDFVSLTYKDSGISKLALINTWPEYKSNKEFNYIERISITALDKNDKTHQFSLGIIWNIDGNWKMSRKSLRVDDISHIIIPFDQYQLLLESAKIYKILVVKKSDSNFGIYGELDSESVVILRKRRIWIRSFVVYVNEMEMKKQEKIWENIKLEYSLSE